MGGGQQSDTYTCQPSHRWERRKLHLTEWSHVPKWSKATNSSQCTATTDTKNSEPYTDSRESNAKTFEDRYLIAQRNLRENFSTINNIQKRVEQLKLVARTSVSSDDFNKMNIERMKLLDQIGFINIGSIRLIKDLHQLTDEQLNSSKRDKLQSNSLLDIFTLQSMQHQEIGTLLNQLDNWYEERKADRLWMKALKKQADAFQITKSFVPSFDESLRHLELIQAQIDLDKKIQRMSNLIDYAVKICERKSDEMDKKSKTKLDKSKKQEVRYIQQEQASSQSSSPIPSTSTGKTRFMDKIKRKQPSSSPDKVQTLFRASKCSKMDKSPQKPPPRTATSWDANVFSWKTSPGRPHDKSMRPNTPVEKTSTIGKLWQQEKIRKPRKPQATQIPSDAWTHRRSTTSKRGSDSIGIQRNSTQLDFIRIKIRKRPRRSGWLPPTQTSADSLHAQPQHQVTSCNDVKLSRSLQWRSGKPHSWVNDDATYSRNVEPELHICSNEHEKKPSIQQPKSSTR